jgi:adenylosuccinate synthase
MSELVHTSVTGLAWGDEAKGDKVDEEAERHDGGVRNNGANNAGHTVIFNGEEVSTSQIPSIVFELKKNPQKWMYIGPGSIVDMPALLAEAQKISAQTGIHNIFGRLRIAANTSVTQPHHILQDLAAGAIIGTTGRGVGWAYSAQCERADGDRRIDIMLGDIDDDPEHFFALMKRNLEVELQRLHGKFYQLTDDQVQEIAAKFKIDERIDKQKAAFEKIRGCVELDPLFVVRQMRANQRVLFEGAQSIYLGKKTGTPPYVTASDTTPGALFSSLFINRDEFKIRNIGVTKAFPTRVGYGPGPTEFGGVRAENYTMEDEGQRHTKDVEHAEFGHRIDEMLRSGDDFEVGRAIRHETRNYGVQSHRPRRPLWLDAVATANAVQLSDIDEILLAQVDYLPLYAKIQNGMRLGIDYIIDDLPVKHFPMTEGRMRKVQVRTEHFEPFADNLSNMHSQEELPQLCIEYLRRCQELFGCPITQIGVGPGRKKKMGLNI